MATWHQSRSTPTLWHPTQHTVVTDTPGGGMGVMRFDDATQANDYLKRLGENDPVAGKHSYVIPPSGTTVTGRSQS